MTLHVESDELVSPKELAQELGYNVATLAWRRSMNYGPPFEKLSDRVLYRRSAVAQWIASGGPLADRLKRRAST